MKKQGWVLPAAVALLASAGCHTTNYTAPERYERGLVVCLSGAGGMMGEVNRIRDGLDSGGVGHAIECFDWSCGVVLSDQANVAENRRKAGRLARRIEAYQRRYPDRPVHLIGVSAGTGLVVWALENLDPERPATGAVLLASSLDAKYDLSRALGRVTDRLYSFHSVADTILSLGVTWAGTVDRGGGIAGGFVGFSPPEDAPAETKRLYEERLVQFAWHPGEMVLGHLGDHLGATNPNYVRIRIAPLVLGEKHPSAPKPKPETDAP